tara:strand:- start:16 stop:456 length:441 start_codon:yes stop_codon:yes gene_type:complete
MVHIILKCILEKGKLRIKFHSYVNDEGKRFLDVYNNSYNCRFPKKNDIRQKDRYYNINPEDLTLTSRNLCNPFYVIKSKNIQIIDELEVLTIYKVEECVICLSNNPSVTFIPCGHYCTCYDCYSYMINNYNTNCPICRSNISKVYN